MKLSVIVPIYNGEKYIKRCLDSICAQIYKDLEIIVIDDGSTDNTARVLKTYIEEHKQNMNLKIICKPNAGLPQARLTGIENSTGDYIGFVDVDDWIEPNMYKSMLSEAEKSDADIVCCAFQMDFTNKTDVIQHETGMKTTMTSEEAIEYLHRRKAIYPYAWNKIYRRDLFCDVTFPEGNFVGEDYTIVIQMLKKARKVSVIPDIGNHYIQVENSMCRGGYNPSYDYSFKNYMEISTDLVKQYPACSRAIHNYMIVEYMAMVIAMGKNKTYNFDMIKKIRQYVRKYLKPFIADKDVSIVMKGSAVVLSVYWRILPIVYNFMAHYAGNYVNDL